MQKGIAIPKYLGNEYMLFTLNNIHIWNTQEQLSIGPGRAHFSGSVCFIMSL